jgi:CBS domain containing-hemolysin-like protein
MAGLLLAVVLLVANGFFVAAEFALIAARQSRIEQLAEEGDARATAAIRSIKELSLMLSAAQLGITIASLLLGYIAEPAVAHLLEDPLEFIGLAHTSSHTVAFILALSIIVFLHMVVGEMVPKNIAIAAPERVALWLARPMRAFTTVFRPVVWTLTWSANVLLRLLRIEPRDELSEARTGDEIADLLAVSRREGVLEEVEHRLMTGALRFPAREVASVMVDRDEIVRVPVTATAAEVEQVALSTGHSRIVVHGRDLDEVLGFVHAKDLLAVAADARDLPLPRTLVRRMLVVPTGRTLQQLLLAMRRARIHAALVVDGEGRTAGVATLEDVLESLVGDIQDEHDAPKA